MKRHIIFTLGRSGSNYLVTLLNKHPAIANYGEVLGEWTTTYKLHQRLGFGGDSAINYLDYLYNSHFPFYAGQVYSALAHLSKKEAINFKTHIKVQTIGIKEFSTNFKRRKVESFLQADDLLLINLYRKNILKRLVSLKKMSQSGVVLLRSNYSDNPTKKLQKVNLDSNNLIRYLDVYQSEIDEHFRIVNSLPSKRVLNISYEDLFASQQSLEHYKQAVFDFLEVASIELESNHRKILPDDLSQVIGNYQEVKDMLVTTPYAKYLDC